VETNAQLEEWEGQNLVGVCVVCVVCVCVCVCVVMIVQCTTMGMSKM